MSIAIIRPEATTNYVLNPSAELSTSNASAYNAATITRYTGWQWRGSYSWGVGPTDTITDNGIDLTCDQFPINTEATLTFWGQFTTGYAYTVQILQNSVAFATYNFTAEATQKGQLKNSQKIEFSFTTSASVLGDSVVRIFLDSGASSARDFYIDAVQVEMKAYSTDYCDGDQAGCYWEGARHASPSHRLATYSKAGRPLHIETDIGAKLGETLIGIGEPPIQWATVQYAQQDGSSVQSKRIGNRRIVLPLTIDVTDQADPATAYAQIRNALFSVFNPDVAPDYQGTLIRFLEAESEADHLQIYTYLQAGFERGYDPTSVTGQVQVINLQLDAYRDPYWQHQSNGLSTLSPHTTVTESGIFVRADGTWLGVNSPTITGVAIDVRLVAYHNYSGLLYVGGDLEDWATAGSDTLCYYDTYANTWADSGTLQFNGGLARVFTALLPEDSDQIIVGGEFNDIDGTTTYRSIGFFSPDSGWSDFSSQFANQHTINALAYDLAGNLYAGGLIDTNADNTPDTAVVQKWDGSSWTEIGRGPATSTTVESLYYDVGSNLLYVAGQFASMDGTSANNIIAYNPSADTWAALGAGTNAIAYDVKSFNGAIYVCGAFTSAGGLTAKYFAAWNGATWFIPTGMDNVISIGGGTAIYKMAVNDGVLYLSTYNLSLDPFDVTDGKTLLWRYTAGLFEPVPVDVDSSSYYRGRCVYADDRFLAVSGTWKEEPVNAPTATTVNNAGSAPALPLYKITDTTNKSKIVYIRNNTTGKELRLGAYAMSENESIFVDAQSNEVYSSIRGGINNAITNGAQPKDLYLISGDNAIELGYLTASGDPTATLTFTPRWHSATGVQGAIV